jgi:Carboxypeptidase regulatory-like domain
MYIRGVKLALVLLLVVCVGSSLPAWAQSTSTGSIAGAVTDPSGAVVAGAAVTLTDTSTNVARTATTNKDGRYIYVDVNPGIYSVAVSKSGFATIKTENQEVKVGASLTLNLALQVGGTNVVVEVTTVGTELQTMNATVGNTVTSLTLDNLPSLGRDVSSFVELQPGVGPDGAVAGAVLDQSYFSLDGGNNSSDMDGSQNVYFSSMAGDPTGGVATQNNLGAGVGGPTGVLPTPQDSVEEFKVNTAGQTADFNSSAGAEVKVVTKRGTNAWHGTAYEYYKDNNWSSQSWENDYENLLQPGSAPLPSFHYSRFGGAIGGPLIPKEILGGKTYFFANYEGFRFPNSETVFRDVPSPALIAGNITDPVTGQVFSLKTADPRGIGVNPLVQQIWKTYEPQSNSTCQQNLCDGANELGFTANVALPTTSNFAVGRVDHDFGAKWHFMSSYRWNKLIANNDNQIDIGGFFSGDTKGVPASISQGPLQSHMLVAALTTNISTNTTNDFHYSFLRNWWAYARQGDTPQTATLGGALEIYSGQTAGEDQDLGPYNVNTQNTRNRFWDGHDQMVRDDISMLKGNHLFQFGGTYQHNWDYHQRTDNGGGINYQPVYELGNGDQGSELASNVSICNDSNIPNCPSLTAAALGIVSIAQTVYTRSGANLALNPPLTPAFDKSTIPYYNVYFSDTWHMKPTFTLTYGLGWTLEMPPVEANGKQVELVDQSDEPISSESYLANRKRAALQGQVYNPEIGFALVGNTANGLKYPYNPFYGSFSPRIAAAWNPHFDSDSLAGKIFGHEDTVVRGGYGRVYGRLNGVDLVLVPLLGTGLMQPVQCVGGAFSNGACGASERTATPATAFRIGVDGLTAPVSSTPVAPTLPQPDFPGYNAASAATAESLDPNFRPNQVDSFDLTIQRQLTRKVTLELGYIGRRITHEYLPINLNAVPTMMTMGGQQFAQAYKNVVLQYCGGIAGLAGGGCAANAGAVTPQPFFEAALKNSPTGYCKGFTSCTAAVVYNEGVASKAGNPNATNNLNNAQVWTLWSDLDSGPFNFPHSMMNTTTGPFGPQMTSGVAVNSSVGFGNYNGGFASIKMADWRGLTMQSNLTWSKALGTAALVQADSEFTPDDPFNPYTMYGPQLFDRRVVYNAFFVYQPPFYKGQHGLLGRALGGWTFSSIFTAGSGSPIQMFTTTGGGQEYGAGDNVNFFGEENAVPIGHVEYGHAYYNRPSSGLPVNFFAQGTAAINNYRNPILGLDNRDGGTGIVSGLRYWNMDFSIKKNFRVTEGISLEFQGVFANALNHNQWQDPLGNADAALFEGPSSFGTLGNGSAQEQPGGNRQIEVGARVRF